jgi:hypothetical protein
MVVEHITGRGILTCSRGDAKVSYSIRVEREELPAASLDNPSATILGLKRITATINFAKLAQQPEVNDKLLLQLEDGRKLSCYYLGAGCLLGTGGFYA